MYYRDWVWPGTTSRCSGTAPTQTAAGYLMFTDPASLRETYAPDHTPLPFRPLLTQLVDAIFDPSRPDLNDVDHHVHGHAVTDILKTGFGYAQEFRRALCSLHGCTEEVSYSVLWNVPLSPSLRLFVSSARPRPSNHPLLLIFVVGGVTCAEVRQIREMLASHKTDVQVREL